jgi:type I restriction enzyme S subunit
MLGTLEKRITKQAQLVDNLKKYKRGLNRRLLSQIEESYNCKLGSVCTIMGGGTPDTLHGEYWGNSVEWFTPSEIGKMKYVNSSVRKLSKEGLINSSAKLLPAGTVLLTTRATLGEMSIAEKECSTNQGFQSLIPLTSRVSSEYLYYMYNAPHCQDSCSDFLS